MEIPKPQQPSLIPDEPQKETDWEALKKAAEENQKRLKEEYWNH